MESDDKDLGHFWLDYINHRNVEFYSLKKRSLVKVISSHLTFDLTFLPQPYGQIRDFLDLLKYDGIPHVHTLLPIQS